MRTAAFLLLPITLILLPNFEAQAQPVESSIDRPYLALVTGDTPNSCSFISADVLERSASIVGDLLFVNPGDSPNLVKSKVRFPNDPVDAADIMQWTATAGGNYTRAVVNFRDNRVQSRTFTMATNYNQPNEKRCEWEVRDPQQRVQSNPPASPLGQ